MEIDDDRVLERKTLPSNSDLDDKCCVAEASLSRIKRLGTIVQAYKVLLGLQWLACLPGKFGNNIITRGQIMTIWMSPNKIEYQANDNAIVHL